MCAQTQGEPLPFLEPISTIRYSVGMHGSTAGGLVKEARAKARLSQAELARRAGTTQSVISAYESGHRQPALTTLAALIAATGLELDVRVVAPRRGLDRLTGPVGRRVRRNRRMVVEAAAEQGITNLRVFGSVARGEDGPDSDVDLLVDLPAGLGLVGLGRVREELERLIGSPVDLVPATDLKPDVARRVEAEVVVL
jgi:predicted nucleotidyltransferase/DNA-binding XRE family transcriptional regulator